MATIKAWGHMVDLEAKKHTEEYQNQELHCLNCLNYTAADVKN